MKAPYCFGVSKHILQEKVVYPSLPQTPIKNGKLFLQGNCSTKSKDLLNISGIDWLFAIFLKFGNIQIKLMLPLIHPDLHIHSMYTYVKIQKKQEGKQK